MSSSSRAPSSHQKGGHGDKPIHRMAELCQRAGIQIPEGKVLDAIALQNACLHTRRGIAKSMGKTIVAMADKGNKIEFNTKGMKEILDEAMKRISTIDSIISVLGTLSKTHEVEDIRRYLSHSSGGEEDTSDDDSDVDLTSGIILEDYGSGKSSKEKKHGHLHRHRSSSEHKGRSNIS
jgi:hypothetical protein